MPEQPAEALTIEQFDRAYRFRMVQAYPVISGVADVHEATHAQIDAGFRRCLEATALRRTHEMYRAEHPRAGKEPVHNRYSADPDAAAAEINARLAACSGPWTFRAAAGDDYGTVWIGEVGELLDRYDAGDQSAWPYPEADTRWTVGGEIDNRADGEFIGHAPDDVHWLLGERERLLAQLRETSRSEATA